MHLLRVKVTGGGESTRSSGGRGERTSWPWRKRQRNRSPAAESTPFSTRRRGCERPWTPGSTLECAVVLLAYLAPLVPIDVLLVGRWKPWRAVSPRRPEGGPSLLLEGGAAPLNNDAAPGMPESRRVEPGGGKGGLWDAFKTHVKRFSQPLWCRIEPGEFLASRGACLPDRVSPEITCFSMICRR